MIKKRSGANRGPLAAVVIAVCALFTMGVMMWVRDREAKAEAAAAAQRRDARRIARENDQARELHTDSIALMPPMLGGVFLGMTEAELRGVRASIAPDARGNEPDLRFMSETMENGAQVVYGLERERGTLVQIQVLSLLPSIEMLRGHLASMNEEYGIPQGVFDCNSGDTPTRRFTWTHGRAAIADVFLVYGDRVSITLYIADTTWITGSLLRSDCSPVPRERIAEFPRADPEALRQR